MNTKQIAEGFPGQRLIVVPSNIIKSTQHAAVIQDLFPTHIGMFHQAKDHYVERLSGAPEHILIGCLAGSGKARIGQQEWQLSAGNMVYLPAHVNHSYSADSASPWSIFWIHFTGNKALHYLRYLDLSETNPLLNILNTGALMEAFEDIYQHTGSAYTDSALLCLSASLCRFLSLCRLHQGAIKANQQEAQDRILGSVDIMKKNVHRTLKLADLATMTGWSATHYCAMFKQHMKVSPVEYFIRLKIHRACNQLKMTRDSISSIALSLGYDDAFYFSRLFRSRQGMAPGEYRKKFSLLK